MPVISTNIAANSAVRHLNTNSAQQSASLSKLASGTRIAQASDDAAGLAISTRISSDVTTLTQAATNASHGISILQTADGGAANISDILQRMKALAAQSASGTVTNAERTYIDAEFSQLIEEIDGIAEGTRYNGQSLLSTQVEVTPAVIDTDGTVTTPADMGPNPFTAGLDIMVGSSEKDMIKLSLDALDSTTLFEDPANAGTALALSVGTSTGALAAITAIDAAIDTVSNARANIGALESRFAFRGASIATSIENLSAANSAIADVDVAAESAKLASAKVKTQAAVAAAAQASQMPETLLKLLN